jgi:hypothetical protein
MRRLAVLEDALTTAIFCKPRQGQFMETFSYYPCWEVPVAVDVRVVALALVVAARS